MCLANMMNLAKKSRRVPIIWARNSLSTIEGTYPWKNMLCSGMGHLEVTPLYAILYYIVNFKDGTTKVLVWKAHVIRKSCTVESSPSRVWHHLHNTKIHKQAIKCWPFSRKPTNDYQLMTDFFHDESILSTKNEEVYLDGVCVLMWP